MTFAQIMVVLALVWMVIALVSNKVPYSVIALSLPLFLIVGGVYETPVSAMSSLTSPTTLLVACIMILVQGMFESGLALAIGKLLLKLTGGRTGETVIFVMIIIVATVMTMFLPNGGTASILLPIVISVSIASGVSRSKTLFVMNTAIGLGGCITLMGTVINMACAGMIAEGGWGSVGFFGFGVAAIPAYILGIAFILTIGRRLLPNYVDEATINGGSMGIQEEEKTPEEIKKQKRSMIFAGIAFVIVVVSVLLEDVIDVQAWVGGTVAVVILIGSKAITEKKAFQIPWGILLFVFACAQMASACKTCGIAELAIDPITNLLGSNPSPYLLTFVCFMLGAFFTQFMSNFGTFGIFSTLCVTLATAVGANPAALLVALAMGCNASYASPMATTCNMLILADSKVQFVDWLKNGIPQIAILCVCSLITLPIAFPFY